MTVRLNAASRRKVRDEKSTVKCGRGDTKAPLLDVVDLSVIYGSERSAVRAVDGVSLQIHSGEAVGVVGESGSGKSTLAHAVLQLLPTTARQSGQVLLQGTDLTTLSDKEIAALRGDVAAMVFQDPMTSFDPQRTIGYHLRESLLAHQPGLSRSNRREVVVDQLRRTGLPEPAYQSTRYPHELSGGMLQRSMLALALENSPALLLADEPTTALDVTIQAQILQLFSELLGDEELGASMLLISHDLAVVRQVCSRTVVMYAGRIVEDAPTEEIFSEPRHPYTQALIRATPKAQRGTTRLSTIPGTTPTISEKPTACSFRQRCQHAVDRCHEEDPRLVALGDDRSVACFIGAKAPLPALDDTAATARSDDATPLNTAVDTASTPVIEVDAVTMTFRTQGVGSNIFRNQSLHALRNVSLDVYRGETLGIVGESGSGKSTLARIMLGLQRPTSGTIRVQGDDPASRRSKARAEQRLQAVFQDPHGSLNPRMSIQEAIAEPLRNMGLSMPERNARAVALLDEVQLGASYSSRFPGELSGGQAQRVAIARALASEPDVIVLDEPTSGLDISIQAHILNLLADLQDRHKLTYVLISHDLTIVQHLADRIAVMYLGRIVELSGGIDTFEHPAHPYTAGLLAAVPDIDNPDKPRPLVVGEPPSPLNPPSGCAYHTRCPLVQEVCSTVDPPLAEHEQRLVACHFPGEISKTPAEVASEGGTS